MLVIKNILFLSISVQCEWGPCEPVPGYTKPCGGGFLFFEGNKTKEERFCGTCNESTFQKNNKTDKTVSPQWGQSSSRGLFRAYAKKLK